MILSFGAITVGITRATFSRDIFGLKETKTMARALEKFVLLVMVSTAFLACNRSEKSPEALSGLKPSTDTGMPTETSQFARDAGVGSGGGGDVVVCYDALGNIKDMESYDVWIAPTNYRLTFSRKPLGENDLHNEPANPDHMGRLELTLKGLEELIRSSRID